MDKKYLTTSQGIPVGSDLSSITTGEKEKIEAKIIAVDDENITLENLENKEKTTINFNDIK